MHKSTSHRITYRRHPQTLEMQKLPVRTSENPTNSLNIHPTIFGSFGNRDRSQARNESCIRKSYSRYTKRPGVNRRSVTNPKEDFRTLASNTSQGSFFYSPGNFIDEELRQEKFIEHEQKQTSSRNAPQIIYGYSEVTPHNINTGNPIYSAKSQASSTYFTPYGDNYHGLHHRTSNTSSHREAGKPTSINASNENNYAEVTTDRLHNNLVSNRNTEQQTYDIQPLMGNYPHSRPGVENHYDTLISPLVRQQICSPNQLFEQEQSNAQRLDYTKFKNQPFTPKYIIILILFIYISISFGLLAIIIFVEYYYFNFQAYGIPSLLILILILTLFIWEATNIKRCQNISKIGSLIIGIGSFIGCIGIFLVLVYFMANKNLTC